MSKKVEFTSSLPYHCAISNVHKCSSFEWCQDFPFRVQFLTALFTANYWWKLTSDNRYETFSRLIIYVRFINHDHGRWIGGIFQILILFGRYDHRIFSICHYYDAHSRWMCLYLVQPPFGLTHYKWHLSAIIMMNINLFINRHKDNRETIHNC